MLGDFITRSLILLLGYAYPGFECYKTVEKNRVDVEELRFWCQYWIIVALLTVLERFADIFMAWLPMYGEMKLALFIYLWYPKTKGTGYLYETVLRPYVSRHETDIERKLHEWRARAWDLAIFYWQNCTELGQSAFFQVLEYLAAQSTRFSSKTTSQKNDLQGQSAPQMPSIQSSFFENKQNNFPGKNKKWPPNPPSSPSNTIRRNISETPKSQTVHVHLNSQTEHLQEEEEALEPEPVTMVQGQDDHHVSVKDRLNGARARLRRLNPQSPRTPSSPLRR